MDFNALAGWVFSELKGVPIVTVPPDCEVRTPALPLSHPLRMPFDDLIVLDIQSPTDTRAVRIEQTFDSDEETIFAFTVSEGFGANAKHADTFFAKSTTSDFLRMPSGTTEHQQKIAAYYTFLFEAHLESLDAFTCVPKENTHLNRAARRRIAKGIDAPEVEYKSTELKRYQWAKSTPQGGAHASPRLHERRGHWRHMKASGKTVWVSSHRVGDPSKGTIISTYTIGAQQ